MTPKEKAIDIYNKSYNMPILPKYINSRKDIAIQCALLEVNEIEDIILSLEHSQQVYDYWVKVRMEIYNL